MNGEIIKRNFCFELSWYILSIRWREDQNKKLVQFPVMNALLIRCFGGRSFSVGFGRYQPDHTNFQQNRALKLNQVRKLLDQVKTVDVLLRSYSSLFQALFSVRVREKEGDTVVSKQETERLLTSAIS